MQRKIVFSEGEYYHIYNRGVEKRRIFLNEKEKERFLKLLYVANDHHAFVFRSIQDTPVAEIIRGDPLVAIGAYVLMPNHFHLLVKEIVPGGISSFMEKLLTSYSSYFNKSHRRVGSLFQGTFKAQHVTYDEYLKYLFAYIHLNPIKMIDKEWKSNGISNLDIAKQFLSEYKYSSYSAFVGVNEDAILSKSVFPDYFLEQQTFENYIEDWLLFKDKEET